MEVNVVRETQLLKGVLDGCVLQIISKKKFMGTSLYKN
ncbi:Transcriptional regulator, PadR family [Enterococcus sp. HSIEG1]|nr:Transcriptional regulator, PadR family [Enterococcus sp. HSIEG1]